MIKIYKYSHITDFTDFYNPLTFEQIIYLIGRIEDYTTNKHIYYMIKK